MKVSNWISARSWTLDRKEEGDVNGWPVADWLWNLETLELWFPEADFFWSSLGAFYATPLSARYTAKVACTIRLPLWKKKGDYSCGLWLIDLENIDDSSSFGLDEVSSLSFLIDMGFQPSMRSWLVEMDVRYEELSYELTTLALFIELLWTQVFVPRIDDVLDGQGVFLGCWLAGLTLDWRPYPR